MHQFKANQSRSKQQGSPFLLEMSLNLTLMVKPNPKGDDLYATHYRGQNTISYSHMSPQHLMLKKYSSPIKRSSMFQCLSLLRKHLMLFQISYQSCLGEIM